MIGQNVGGGQSSSAVEQRTHKPLVVGSIPSSGTTLKANKTSINTGLNTGSPLGPSILFKECKGVETGKFWQPPATVSRVSRGTDHWGGGHPP